jgi:hypothetical protein
MNPNDFKFNEKMLALIPEAHESDKLAMQEDIIQRVSMLGKDSDNILIQDILLDPAGLVIDGRTRIMIMKSLGLDIHANRIRKLKYGTSQKEIEFEIKSANIRRNLTITQKAAVAARAYLSMKHRGEKGVSIPVISKGWGVSKATLENALYIHKQDESIFEALWSGSSVEITNSDGKRTTTISINSVCQYLKREAEVAVRINQDHQWNPNSYITTQKGKDMYYELIRSNEGNVGIRIQMILAEYINIKTEKADQDFYDLTQAIRTTSLM